MAKDPNSCESNSRGISEGIPYKHSGRITVVVKQGKRRGDKRNDDNRRENMIIHVVYNQVKK